MPVYRCPKCGRTVEKPEGTYYCKVCGRETIMEMLEGAAYRIRTPLDEAIEILPRYYYCPDAIKRLEWYFGHDWETLRKTSLELLEETNDWDDTVAWELHELVEACEVYKTAPWLKSPVLSVPFQEGFIENIKPKAHQKATQIELEFLRDRGRYDLVKKVQERERKTLKKRS